MIRDNRVKDAIESLDNQRIQTLKKQMEDHPDEVCSGNKEDIGGPHQLSLWTTKVEPCRVVLSAEMQRHRQGSNEIDTSAEGTVKVPLTVEAGLKAHRQG